MKKRNILLAAGAAVLIITAAAAAAVLFFTSRVSYDEELTGPVTGKVTIRRDAGGYPLITADSAGDALFALGYLHATDMLPLMEYLRSISAGEASRLIGNEGIPLDRFAKIMGFRRKASETAGRLKEPYRSYLNAYSAGVNFRISGSHMLTADVNTGWSADDTLAVLLMLEWTNSYLNNRELFFQFPAKKFPLLKKNTLPDNLVRSYAEGEEPGLTVVNDLKNLIQKHIGPFNRGTAFYISPAGIKSGSAAYGFTMHNSMAVYPGWFPVAIDTPDFKIRGITHAGMPFFFEGSSEKNGFLTMNADIDTQEFFIETVKKVNDEIGYQTPAGWKKFIPVKETEIVDGLEKSRIIWETENGPVLNDIFSNEEYSNNVITVKSVFSDETAVEALFRVPESASIMDGINAVRNVRSAPRFYIFHKDQELVRTYSGRLLKSRETRKVFSQPAGFARTDEISLSVFNYKKFYQSTVTGSSFPDDLSADIAFYCPAETSLRKRFEVLTSPPNQFREKEIKSILDDTKCVYAEKFTPLFLSMLSSNPVTSSKLSRIYLHAWNSSITPDDPSPVLFYTILQRYIHEVFADEFPETINSIVSNYRYILPQFYDMIHTGQAHYFNDITTDNYETRETIFDRAFFKSMRYLSRKNGPEMNSWTWSRNHRGAFAVPPSEDTISDKFMRPDYSRSFQHSLSSFAFSGIQLDLTPGMITSLSSYRTIKYSGIKMNYSYSLNPMSEFCYGKSPEPVIVNIDSVNGKHLTVIAPAAAAAITGK